MIKHYCDICKEGIERDDVFRVHVEYNKSWIDKPRELCGKCYNRFCKEFPEPKDGDVNE